MLQTDIKTREVITRLLTLMLTVMICMVIFKFSSEDSGESTSTSDLVINYIININPFTKHLDIVQKEEIKEQMKLPIRKLAHFSIYTLLGISVMCHISTYKINKYKKITISLLIGMMYAISDEIHQLFIPGRSGQVTDVLIDSIGFLFGISVILLMQKILMKCKKMDN